MPKRPLFIASPRDVLRIPEVRDLRRAEQERGVVVALTNDLHHLGSAVVFVGTADEVWVHPRDVFRFLLRRNACSFVFVHNHPHGPRVPSPEDRALTLRLERAGDVVGIPLVRHLLVCPGTSDPLPILSSPSSRARAWTSF